jgi:hypothetical protein
LDFDNNRQKFDFIFLNDVFEYVSHPIELLKKLSGKLEFCGKLFIDTPKQFWLYPVTKLFSKSLYEKVLIGTVSTNHLQIWIRKSFEFVVRQSDMQIDKYDEVSEYTMPSDYYLRGMNINNPMLKFVGRFFHANAKSLANNKILAVLTVKYCHQLIFYALKFRWLPRLIAKNGLRALRLIELTAIPLIKPSLSTLRVIGAPAHTLAAPRLC